MAVDNLTVESPASASAHLWRYRAVRVTIYYASQTSYNDTGKITYMDNHWVELTKENEERLLIPVTSIRLIKALEKLAPEGDAAALLRPAEGAPPIEQRQRP